MGNCFFCLFVCLFVCFVQSGTELTAEVLKKKKKKKKDFFKTHTSLNNTLFNETKQDRMHIFERILLFKARNYTKTNK